MDLCGPFCNINVILALIDEYSRWPEVYAFRGDPGALQIPEIKFNQQHAKVKIEIGDNILMKQIKPNKPSAHFNPYPMRVFQMHVSQVIKIIMKKYLAEISAFSKQ